MDWNFDYYEGRDLARPPKPSKPVLPANPSSAEAKLFATQLEKWEHDMRLCDDAVRMIRVEKERRMAEFRELIRDEYQLNNGQFVILWAYAWERGHSSGLPDVIGHFLEIFEVATAFADAGNG